MKTPNIFILLSTIFIAAGCGGPGTSAKDFARFPSSCTGPSCTEELQPARKQKVEAVISQRQVLPNFQRCLGLLPNQVSGTSKTAYRESISSLSMDGMVEDISAPMFMAITKVASELCLDLVNVELNSNNRRFFPGFTLGGSATNTQSFNLSGTLTTLANACWGRSISSAEAEIVTKEIGAGKDKAAAIFACSALLSSTAAIRY